MKEQESSRGISIEVIQRPETKWIIKRAKEATRYFEYCKEVGCAVWAELSNIENALGEPVGMWLPKHLIKPSTSVYVQGIEVPLDGDSIIVEGYEVILLPPCKYMRFQGMPYEEKDFMKAISALQNDIQKFDPTLHGYRWALEKHPRFQLEPKAHRGYMEAWPVKALAEETDFKNKGHSSDLFL